MVVSISELYGKKVITNSGNMLGVVKEIVIDLENNEVSHLLFTKLEHLAKSGDVRNTLRKNSVLYKRVKNVGESIIVSSQ
jgi:sporulation protein YlmC with PRC-barrel domain